MADENKPEEQKPSLTVELKSDEAKPLFRDAIGQFAAFVVVLVFCAEGYVVVASKIVFATEIIFPAAWETTLGNMAMAALGVLIGQNMKRSP